MNRVIKFRGLKDDMSNCNWVHGSLVYDASGQPRIANVDTSGEGLTFHTCINGTECQFIGIQDKNGNDIYEGDVVYKFYGDHSVKERLKGAKGVVKFGRYLVLKDDWGMDHFATGWHMTFSDNSGSIEITEKFEVIGNIHENPELL